MTAPKNQLDKMLDEYGQRVRILFDDCWPWTMDERFAALSAMRRAPLLLALLKRVTEQDAA